MRVWVVSPMRVRVRWMLRHDDKGITQHRGDRTHSFLIIPSELHHTPFHAQCVPFFVVFQVPSPLVHFAPFVDLYSDLSTFSCAGSPGGGGAGGGAAGRGVGHALQVTGQAFRVASPQDPPFVQYPQDFISAQLYWLSTPLGLSAQGPRPHTPQLFGQILRIHTQYCGPYAAVSEHRSAPSPSESVILVHVWQSLALSSHAAAELEPAVRRATGAFPGTEHSPQLFAQFSLIHGP